MGSSPGKGTAGCSESFDQAKDTVLGSSHHAKATLTGLAPDEARLRTVNLS